MKLHDEYTVFMAELTAINNALNYILLNLKHTRVNIIMDSKSALDIISITENRIFVKNKIHYCENIVLFGLRLMQEKAATRRPIFKYTSTFLMFL